MIFSFVLLNYLLNCHAKVLLFFQIAKILVLFLVLNFPPRKCISFFGTSAHASSSEKNFFLFFLPYRQAIHKTAGGGSASAFGVFRPHAEAISTI